MTDSIYFRSVTRATEKWAELRQGGGIKLDSGRVNQPSMVFDTGLPAPGDRTSRGPLHPWGGSSALIIGVRQEIGTQMSLTESSTGAIQKPSKRNFLSSASEYAKFG
jgi:hypothetical protein